MATYDLSTSRRFVNRAFGLLVRLGIGPSNAHLLTTIGRKTGQPRTAPVALVERHGEGWLVSPYGTRPWVLNARAAGRVELRRGRTRTEWNIEETDATTAAAVLRQYLAENKITAPYFDATTEDGDSAFEAEASRHPVFRLRPAVG
ncbi:MAG: nitroreductase family deazaflavin-dependent oxidoreductase [Dehalococcoidia bacterium]|nr:nitroreductase family deazaflavin-dependent oxidoreductase [Dehalococcoidia bacterium]